MKGDFGQAGTVNNVLLEHKYFPPPALKSGIRAVFPLWPSYRRLNVSLTVNLWTQKATLSCQLLCYSMQISHYMLSKFFASAVIDLYFVLVKILLDVLRHLDLHTNPLAPNQTNIGAMLDLFYRSRIKMDLNIHKRGGNVTKKCLLFPSTPHLLPISHLLPPPTPLCLSRVLFTA